MNPPSPFGLTLVVWSMAVFWTSLEAIRRTIWYDRSVRRGKLPQTIGPEKPSVLVVRPCAGAEPSLERTLSSLAQAKRSFDVVCRLAIESEQDAAIGAARRAVVANYSRGRRVAQYEAFYRALQAAEHVGPGEDGGLGMPAGRAG